MFLCAADFNKDGLKDIATSNSGTNDVSVLLGTGGGNLGTTSSFTVGSQPYSICYADFNGDNNPDIATANNGSNDVSILLATGWMDLLQQQFNQARAKIPIASAPI